MKHSRKSFFTLLLAVMLPAIAMLADDANTLAISDFTASAGSQSTFSIQMSNKDDIVSFQVDIYLPEGVSYALNDDGIELIELSTARTDLTRHTISCGRQSDGAMRVVCTSLNNLTFKGTAGEVLTVTIAVEKSVADGSYPIYLRNIELATANMNKYETDEILGVLTVGESSYDEGFSLEIAPFTLSEDREDIGINLSNATPLTSVEFDMTLPSSFLAIEGYGIALGTSTSSKKFSASIEDNGDGTIHVSCTRKNANKFFEDYGNILNLELWFEDEDGVPVSEDGVYELTLKNILMTDEYDKEYHAAPYTTSFFVGDLTTLTEVPTFSGTYDDEGVAAFNAAFEDNAVVASFDFSEAVVASTIALAAANKNAVFFLGMESNVENERNVVIDGVCDKLVLTDGSTFAPGRSFTAESASYGRTLGKDEYGTLVLPFEPNAATKAAYAFYELSEADGSTLTFDETTAPEAGTPYVIVRKDDAATFAGSGAIAVTADDAMADGWTMKGTYETLVFTDATELASLYCLSGNQFKQAKSKLTINPFRAYFQGSGTVGSITLRGNDGTTRILSETLEPVGDCYDLTGRRVLNAEKGVYIVNGKKVLK